MKKAAWSGNITLRMDEKEDTYSPVGSMEIEKYGEDAFRLKIVGGEGRCSATMRMNRKDCEEIMRKFKAVL